MDEDGVEKDIVYRLGPLTAAIQQLAIQMKNLKGKKLFIWKRTEKKKNNP